MSNANSLARDLNYDDNPYTTGISKLELYKSYQQAPFLSHVWDHRLAVCIIDW